MKKVFTFLWALLLASQVFAQEVIVPADNNNGTSRRQPLAGYFGYERSHILFSGSDISASGNITAIAFYVNSLSSPSSYPAQIYMKTSQLQTVTASTVSDVETGATLVWSGTIDATAMTANAWYNIALTTPFNYVPGSSLEILVKTEAGGTGTEGSTAKQFRCSAPGATMFQSWAQDNTEPTGNGTTNANRPNVRFTFAPSAAATVGVSGVLSPAGSCNLTATTPVRIRVRNNGTEAQSNIPVSYRINNGSAVSEVLNGTLASGQVAEYTFSAPANLSTVGTYKFDFWTSLAGDMFAFDDTLKNYTINKIAPANITPVTFSGFTGTNLSNVFTGWSEGTGLARPTGTTSSWTSNTGMFAGDTVASINLFGTSKRDWIASPMFVPNASSGFNFDVAVSDALNTPTPINMGSDDSLNVRITEDCGATWKTVYSITAANAPGVTQTTYSVPLGAYAGKEIRVGIFATEGSFDDVEDYFVFLDDIQLRVLPGTDAGVSAILSPINSTCALSNSTQIKVRIRNAGTDTQTSIPVKYRINGGTIITESFAGNLIAGASAEYTFAATADMSAVGNYQIKVWTALGGDNQLANDTSTLSVIKTAPGTFMPVSFTGFTGGNLATVFPSWSEGSGQVRPTGTTSQWASSTTIFPGDTVASINLYTSSKREWIASSTTFIPTASNGLAFKAAVRLYSNTSVTSPMGADDSVSVRITEDCGLTWKTVFSITAANAPGIDQTDFTVPLAAYAGREIRVGFFATEGTVAAEDYYFLLDDIQLVTISAVNVGVTTILSPVGTCGLTNATPVIIRIINTGSNTQTSVPVSYSINGATPVAETFTGTLTAGAMAEYTFTTPANLAASGTYNFVAWTSLSGDNITINDSAKTTIVKPAIGSLAVVDFGGFTGGNLPTAFPGWSEATGQAKPTGTTSAWESNSSIFAGDTVARINLYTAARRDWIVSPVFIPSASDALAFTSAIRKYSPTTDPSPMGSDDSVSVRITQDCGLTWQTLFSITATNAPGIEKTDFSVILSAYAGKEVRIGFFATEGTTDDSEDYYFILDDIQLATITPNNVGVSSILTPTGICDLSATSTVKIRVRNAGTSAQTSIPVNYRVNGGTAVSETMTGTLAAGATAEYTFTTPANLSASGTYNIEAWTSLSGDAVIANDSAQTSVTKAAVGNLLPVNFTGFSGGNLSSVFPGWSEADGAIAPSGTASDWISNGVILGDDVAAINLYSTSKNEWIISPIFVPSSASGLSFTAAIRDFSPTTDSSAMGSDDSVKVMVTADCGQTWQTLRGFGVANAPGKNKTEYAVSLGAYANQEIRIAFFATEGTTDDTEDYYFLLDDIQLKTLIANNVGVSKMISPLNNCGLAAQAQVKVQVRNYGTAAQTSFPISYSINGTVATETFNGNLAPGDTAVYTFNTPAFVGVAKPYNFICWTSLNGDPVISNDSARYRLVRYGTPITPVTFTSYTGTNLSEDAEGWTEAIGTTAANNSDSEWKSGGIVGNSTARVTLTGDDQKAWLVSPPVKLSGAPVLFFKAAVRTPNNGTTLGTFGADDKVAVMVSTDCGATWTEAFALNGSTSPALSASLTSYTLDLATYANQEVKIGFYATDGTVATPGCDVHLDDIELRNNLATDGGAVEFVSPPAVMAPGVSYPVQVRYRNFGTSSISNFRIAAEIGGATFSTFLFSNVAANTQNTITLPGSFIAPASGTVNGFAYTEVLGDQDMVNDTTYSVFTVQLPVSVKDAKSLNVKVYPNPSNGAFKIKLGDIVTANAVVRMFSLDGKQVHESSFHGIAGQEVLEVKTENLTQGLYILQLEVAGQRLVTKVSVK